jgi:pyruvate/2-oxoglutarate dehydrogenase complex dihydrolipoamide acyltransferase (E2) component
VDSISGYYHMPETDGLTTAIFMILMIILGDIGEKLGVVDGQIAIREYLNMTLMVDHDIIAG